MFRVLRGIGAVAASNTVPFTPLGFADAPLPSGTVFSLPWGVLTNPAFPVVDAAMYGLTQNVTSVMNATNAAPSLVPMLVDAMVSMSIVCILLPLLLLVYAMLYAHGLIGVPNSPHCSRIIYSRALYFCCIKYE